MINTKKKKEKRHKQSISSPAPARWFMFARAKESKKEKFVLRVRRSYYIIIKLFVVFVDGTVCH